MTAMKESLRRKVLFRESFVYAIFVDFPDRTYVKIGRTSDVAPRAYSLQIGCPFPVRSIYACDMVDPAESVRKERMLHRHHRENHFRGEWFTPFKGVASDQEALDFESEMLSMSSKGIPGAIFSYRWTPSKIVSKNIRLIKTQVTPKETKDLPFFMLKDPKEKAKALYDLAIHRLNEAETPLSMRKGRRYKKC